MKTKIIYLIGVVALLVIASCSGSKTYRGLWKGTTADGLKVEITFEANSFTVKDSAGKISTYDYKQSSVEVKNSIKTYGIQLSDGRYYNIHFPYANDESTALIKDGSGNTLYVINRNDYVYFEDIFKLN